MAANVYEGMFILDSNRFADQEAVSAKFPRWSRNLAAKCWSAGFGKNAAWPIRSKGSAKGIYWLTYFRLESRKLVELRRQCQITDDIVRFLFLKEDPRIVDALVAHARSAPVPTAPVEAPAAQATPAATVPEEGIEEEGVDAVAELDDEET